MDIGNALLGFFISIPFLDEIIGEAHRQGTLPRDAEIGDIPFPGLGVRHATAALNRPELGVIENPFQLVLRLSGTVLLRAEDDAEGEILETRPLNLSVRLDMNVASDENGVPVVGFSAAGVEPPVEPAEFEPFIDFFINRDEIQALLDDFQLPLFDALIDAVADVLFPPDDDDNDDNDVDPPDASAYAVLPVLLPATEIAPPCIAAFVAGPGTTLAPGVTASPIDGLTEIGIGYSETFLNLSLAQGAEAQVGEEVDGAVLRGLTMEMGPARILVDGRAERSEAGVTVAEITFAGPIILRFRRAQRTLIADADQVDVDVDLAWWIPLVSALSFLTGITFGLSINAQFIFPGIDEAEEAPETVRSSLVGTLTTQLARLVEGLADTDSFSGVDGYVIPDFATFRANGMAFFAEVIVRPFEAEIVDARRYRTPGSDNYDRPFQEFDLSNGRTYPVVDLARLLIRGFIEIPGYHGVGGPSRPYVRGNPDGAPGNNLDERFPGTAEPDF